MQLLASILYILTRAPQDDDLDDGVLQQKCSELQEEAKKLGESLCKLDKKTGSSLKKMMPPPDQLQKFNDWVDKLEKMMNGILDTF